MPVKDLKGNRGLLISIIVFAFLIASGYLFINPVFKYLASYLSKSEQVKANVLIVEGWVPDYALEMAYEEFTRNEYEYIITTGSNSFTRYFNVSSIGYLIFKIKGKLNGLADSGIHTIEIDAYSEMGGINRAHFNLYINDSLVNDFLVDKRGGKYITEWDGYLDDIDSILIHFDNDSYGEFGDRNLYVREIKIDQKIRIPYLNNTEYDILNLDGKQRIINKSITLAESAKDKLIALGIDSGIIIAVMCQRVRINRTLTSALAVRDWLEKSDIGIKGINIISMGPHARRTWMTYNKILNEKYEIGIISIPDNNNHQLSRRNTLNILRQTLGILYYWLILTPY